MLLTVKPAAGNGVGTTVDGRVFCYNNSGTSWATLRAGSASLLTQPTATVAYMPELYSNITSNLYNRLSRGFLHFDTSAIGTGTITAASLFLFPTSKAVQLGDTTVVVVSSTVTSDNTLANSDYNQVGSVSFGSKTISTFTTGAYNEIALDTSCVNKTGITKLALRLGWDFNNNYTGTWVAEGTTGIYVRQADYADTNYHPYLSVTYNNAVTNKYQMIL
jgi:hypothetical protein